jgi:hypothetical protein
MDEMKQAREIDAAMRELVDRRDKALSDVLRLSSTRRSALAACLARNFPVDSILLEVAVTRDRALHQSSVRIPAAVESILQRELAVAEPMAATSRAPFWLSGLKLQLAAVLTACVLITVALLGLGRWKNPRSNARSVPPGPLLQTMRLESGLEPFVRTIAIGPFNLNTNEPASLQASLFASRKIRFSDGKDTPLGLRLDLPMMTASSEDGFARTP